MNLNIRNIVLRPLMAVTVLVSGCSESFLDENPDFMDPDYAALSNVVGFESAIAALHAAARDQFTDSTTPFHMHVGTDIATIGDPALSESKNVLTSITPNTNNALFYWHWAYLNVLPRANTIIAAAERNPVAWKDEAQKNFYIAEAKFFRAYAHNFLVNIYGRIPVVNEAIRTPKDDFVRAGRKETFEMIRDDLKFAAQWLPEQASADGRVTKAAAQHLLTEVYICLEEYDLAIETASEVIESPHYELMKTRFGSQKTLPGDPFSDLFLDGNQSRSSGNKEMIFCYQVEYDTPGGGGKASGNIWIRAFGCRYFDLKDPAGGAGMAVCDSLGRSTGWIRMSNYANYDIWKDDWNDMRNSKYNIRREWYFNNGDYKGQKVPDWSESFKYDSMYVLFPRWRKVEGLAKGGATIGRTYKDYPVMRLAETYLLRAEAYMKKGGDANLQLAADDINEVRGRANAKPCTKDQVTIDYILDERARELMIEEPRRKTLSRTGTLYRRVKEYAIREETRTTVRDFHQWYPMPQSAIDANKGAPLGQAYGYPGATDTEIIPLL